MKKFRIILIAILSSFLFGACNMLEFDETNGLMEKEDIYKYFGRTKNMLNHVYSFMPQQAAMGGSTDINGVAMNDAASDDAEFGNIGASVQNVNNGRWSAKNAYDSKWNLYKGIRAANGFIVEIDNCDFSRFEHQEGYKNWMLQMKSFKSEARILRAYYFFELARRYGDIAMPLAVLSEEEANSIGKTPFQEVIKFIVKECDECIGKETLPENYQSIPGSEIGRVTKGFAMALKSKALLYAASPLHNPENNVELWKASAKAALDIIESGIYQLDANGAVNDLTSSENVLMRANKANSDFEKFNFPLRFTDGARTGGYVDWCNFPTQNLVDAFETVNGYKVTLTNTGWVSDDPSFDPSQPYANRDKRFYRTIIADGMTFKGEEIQLFEGGADNKAVSLGGSPTGYFLRKFIQENTSFDPAQIVTEKHHWIIYRYAETLLTYAESMINAFGHANYKDGTYTKSARWAINQVRQNAEMPDIKVTGKDEFMEAVRNEWRVEFAFEDHRFWDVRRWKIGNQTQRTISAVKIRKTGETKKYYLQTYENRSWKECMNLFPIPQEELFKNPNLAPQNVGW